MTTPDFKAMTLAEAEEWMQSISEPKYRAKQIRSWIFEKGVDDFHLMTNLGKTLREILNENASVTTIKEVNQQTSSDGTKKFLFQTEDEHTFESVYIPEDKLRTLCVSTQVGCKFGCRFCLTGKSGFVRNLTVGEIVDQLVQVRRKQSQVTNIVLMGMGEPLDNYDNVLQALKVWTEPENGLIGARKVTLSTCGVAPRIKQLAHDFPQVKLAISINGATDEVRSKLMPINKKYPLSELITALREWPMPKGRLFTFEYVLIKNVNDSDKDALALANLAAQIPSKINLIPFNRCPGLPYERPDKKRIERFMSLASSKGRMVFPRHSRGADILAACGQLRESF